MGCNASASAMAANPKTPSSEAGPPSPTLLQANVHAGEHAHAGSEKLFASLAEDPSKLPGEQETAAEFLARTVAVPSRPPCRRGAADVHKCAEKLSVGAKVRVSSNFLSDDASKQPLQVGTAGIVRRTDTEGDALIEFEGVKLCKWVFAHNFENLVDQDGVQIAAAKPAPAPAIPTPPAGPSRQVMAEQNQEVACFHVSSPSSTSQSSRSSGHLDPRKHRGSHHVSSPSESQSTQSSLHLEPLASHARDLAMVPVVELAVDSVVPEWSLRSPLSPEQRRLEPFSPTAVEPWMQAGPMEPFQPVTAAGKTSLQNLKVTAAEKSALDECPTLLSQCYQAELVELDVSGVVGGA